MLKEKLEFYKNKNEYIKYSTIIQCLKFSNLLTNLSIQVLKYQ